jgi:hypothetical protein
MQSRAWAITWRKWLLLMAFVTTTGVCSLPAQTSEDLELTRAARHFRRQVYLQYRTDRPEFDRRRAAAQQAEAAYHEGGGKAEDGERLRTWLLAAAAASQSRAALPAAPTFGPETRVAEEAAPKSPLTGADQAPEAPPESLTPGKIPLDLPPVAEVEQPAPVETPPAAHEATPPPQSKPIAEVEDTPSHEPAVEESPADEPVVTEHTPTEPAPSAATPAEETPFEDAPTEEMPIEHPYEEQAPDALEEPAADGDAPTDEPASSFEDIFDMEENETEESPPAETSPTVVPPATNIESPDAPTFHPDTPSSSGVNVSELTSRVAGHNFAVQAILLDWRRAGNDDVEELAKAVEKTESLGLRYGLLKTYVGLVSDKEREQAGELEPLDDVFTALGNGIADLREQTEASDLPAEKRTAAVERLNQLSRRLAKAYQAYEADSEH